MKQSQDTPNDTSPDLDLIRQVGDKAMQRLMEEFQLKLDPQNNNSSPSKNSSTELPQDQQDPKSQTDL